MKVTHHFLENGDLYSKEIKLDPNEFIVQHTHAYDHFGILAEGEVVVIVGGKAVRIKAPACIPILANVEHSVRAITPVTWYCTHATKSKDPDTIDEVIVGS